MDIQCNICKATFLKTTREKAYVFLVAKTLQAAASSSADTPYRLTEHAVNKHSKTLPDCFPSFASTA